MKKLPLILLLTLATAYEPLRSGFNFASQSCEYFPTFGQFINSFINVQHIIGYGIISLIALLTLQNVAIWQTILGVLVFSATMEVFQSFFSTGHCRAWDLVPNIIGVSWALVIFLLTRHFLKQNKFFRDQHT